MRGISRLLTASLIGVLMLLGSAAGAQPTTNVQPAEQAAVIHGLVTDDAGAPVAGAMVSAIGAATIFAISDRSGKFELGALAPGSYLVRAHRAGFAASRTVTVEVRAGGRASSNLTLSWPPVSG
jgi:protocatechuate 3,4-dioxygenase beta subunit